MTRTDWNYYDWQLIHEGPQDPVLHMALDAVIWCTGFKPALDYLRSLRIVDDAGFVAMDETRFRSE